MIHPRPVACQRPTKRYPEGRTGTEAGYQAHRTAGEPACAQCLDGLKGRRQAAYRKNREAVIVRTRAWNLANPDKRRNIQKRHESKPETRARHREWELKNPDKSHRLRNLVVIREAKNRPCADCGIRYPYYIMQFDHPASTLKLFTIGSRGPVTSRRRLLAEIAKCDVVCANCHAERTYGGEKDAL